jgi:hypothetical protein
MRIASCTLLDEPPAAPIILAEMIPVETAQGADHLVEGGTHVASALLDLVDVSMDLLLAQQRRAGHAVMLGHAHYPEQIGLLRALAQTFELKRADEGRHLGRPRLR